MTWKTIGMTAAREGLKLECLSRSARTVEWSEPLYMWLLQEDFDGDTRVIAGTLSDNRLVPCDEFDDPSEPPDWSIVEDDGVYVDP